MWGWSFNLFWGHFLSVCSLSRGTKNNRKDHGGYGQWTLPNKVSPNWSPILLMWEYPCSYPLISIMMLASGILRRMCWTIQWAFSSVVECWGWWRDWWWRTGANNTNRATITISSSTTTNTWVLTNNKPPDNQTTQKHRK